jgi:hypothetical protein
MLEEIKRNYKNFHDGLVFEVNYHPSNNGFKKDSIAIATVLLQAKNYQTDKIERVKIIFEDVVKFNFFESPQFCSSVIFEAFIGTIENLIVFDFFALQVDGRDKLGEDPKSSFVIHCKKIRFEKYPSGGPTLFPPPSEAFDFGQLGL